MERTNQPRQGLFTHAMMLSAMVFLLLLFASSASAASPQGAQANPMQFMGQMLENYLDKTNGGVYHALSQDWSTPVDPGKQCDEQFSFARTYVFQNMMTGNPAARDSAKELSDFVLKTFEDTAHGGFFSRAANDWKITDRSKSPRVISTAFATLMHLYEITFDDTYLLKCFDLMDLVLDKCWDKTQGGFYDAFAEDWTPTSTTKSLSTQMETILHLAGAWKDGIDSPYAARAEQYKQKSVEITRLIIDKMYDREHGGFFTSCNADWSVKDDRKDTAETTAAITTLFFIYHNLGPVIWGPRKGSHAYSPFRPVNDSYSYLGPAPDPRPIGKDAYEVGKIVVELARLLVDKSWDGKQGGFYTTSTRAWMPEEGDKSAKVQADCLTALNIAYKLSGDSTIREKLEQLQKTLSEKAEDKLHKGYFQYYSPDWQPKAKDKVFSVNNGIMGGIAMSFGTVNGPPLSPVKLKVWIEPESLSVKEGDAAQYAVTIQNQGFNAEKVRIGGLMALSRWMQPGEFPIELAPHQVYTYTLKVRPPEGLSGKTYPFEISAIGENDRKNYFSDIALVSIE